MSTPKRNCGISGFTQTLRNACRRPIRFCERSAFRCSGSRLSGNRNTIAKNAEAHIEAETNAGNCRLAVAKSSPASSAPRAGPTIKPMPKAAPISPIPLARSSSLVISVIYACAAAIFPAIRPAITRDRATIQRDSAKPSKRYPAIAPIMLSMSMGRRP